MRALEREVLDFGERTGVQLDWCATDPQPPLPNDRAAQVSWIAQEALHNVERHADAQCVSVALLQVNDQLSSRIADDGSGFGVGQVAEDRFGLPGMRERAETLGGQLRVSRMGGQDAQLAFTMKDEACARYESYWQMIRTSFALA